MRSRLNCSQQGDVSSAPLTAQEKQEWRNAVVERLSARGRRCREGKAIAFDCGCDVRAVNELLTDVPDQSGTWHRRLTLLAFAARLRPMDQS